MFLDILLMLYLGYRSGALHHVPAACDGYGDRKRLHLFLLSYVITKLCEEQENLNASAPLDYYEMICTKEKGVITKFVHNFCTVID